MRVRVGKTQAYTASLYSSGHYLPSALLLAFPLLVKTAAYCDRDSSPPSGPLLLPALKTFDRKKALGSAINNSTPSAHSNCGVQIHGFNHTRTENLKQTASRRNMQSTFQ